MPRSDWRVVVTIIGCLALAWAAVSQSHNTNHQRYQSYRYAADKPVEVDPALTRMPGAQPLENRRPCEDPTGKDESDLCAQWRAAEAAENSAFWAKWGFWIAVVGSGFLLWQIALTRRAVEDTGEATEAMREANRIAQETALLERRPWIVLDVQPDSSLEFISSAEGCVMQTDIRIKMKNIGKVPAEHVIAWGALFIDIYLSQEIRDPIIADLKQRVARIRATLAERGVSRTVMPGQTIEISPTVQCAAVNNEIIGRIIAYAEYTFAGERETHRTIASYDMTRAGENGKTRIILASDGSIERANIMIQANGAGDAT